VALQSAAALAWAAALASASAPAHAGEPAANPGISLATPAALPHVKVGAPIAIVGGVADIDRESREVVLAGADGDRIPITVPTSVAHIDRVAVGDELAITYYAPVALAIRNVSGVLPENAIAKTVLLAPASRAQGRIASDTVERVGVLRSVDTGRRSLKLEVPAGDFVAFRVDEAVDLGAHDVGERVVVTHTEAIATKLTQP